VFLITLSYDFTTFTTFTTFNHDLRSRSPRLERSRLKWGEGGVKIAENLSFGTFRTLVMARARRPPPQTVLAVALKLRVRLSPVDRPRRTPVREVLSLSLRAHIEVFGSAAATKRTRPRRWAPFQKTFKEKAVSRETLDQPPCAGGAAALQVRARLNPADDPRRTPVREVLSPNFMSHIEVFGSAAATKRTRPRRWPLNPPPTRGFFFLICGNARDAPPKAPPPGSQIFLPDLQVVGF